MNYENELKKYLDNISGSKVIICRAGECGNAGFMIAFELSNKYNFWIYCAWIILDKDKVLATSADELEIRTGLTYKKVQLLEGKIVDSIELNPRNDLFVNFIDDFRLNAFCVILNTYEFSSNWELWIPNQNLIYTVTNHREVKRNKAHIIV